MVNQDYEFLIMLHEFVEAYLCMRHGIPESVIDAYDKTYEASRPRGDNSEPGDDIHCPYRREHQIASEVEDVVASELNVHDEDYQRACDRMFASNDEIEMCTCHMPAESTVNTMKPCPIHGGA